VPTRCRHRGGIVDPLGCKDCRAIRQPISPSTQIQDHSIQKSPKTSQFSVIRRFIGIESHASESYYHSYIATSGVHRIASQICHNRLFRKKLQQNILRMVSTEVLSLAAHNTSHENSQRDCISRTASMSSCDSMNFATMPCSAARTNVVLQIVISTITVV
jgi:hypothetical protein